MARRIDKRVVIVELFVDRPFPFESAHGLCGVHQDHRLAGKIMSKDGEFALRIEKSKNRVRFQWARNLGDRLSSVPLRS